MGRPQQAMTVLPDALDDEKLVIVKACSSLRLTEEIRAGAEFASALNRTFVLAIPDDCVLHAELETFARTADIKLVRVPEEQTP